MTNRENRLIEGKALFNEISQLIEQSQQQLNTQANSTLTMLFWHIGNPH